MRRLVLFTLQFREEGKVLVAVRASPGGGAEPGLRRERPLYTLWIHAGTTV